MPRRPFSSSASTDSSSDRLRARTLSRKSSSPATWWHSWIRACRRTASRKAARLPCAASVTATNASTGKPAVSGSSTAVTPRMMPPSTSLRTRSAAAGAESPSAVPRSAQLARPSSCSAAMAFESIASSMKYIVIESIDDTWRTDQQYGDALRLCRDSRNHGRFRRRLARRPRDPGRMDARRARRGLRLVRLRSRSRCDVRHRQGRHPRVRACLRHRPHRDQRLPRDPDALLDAGDCRARAGGGATSRWDAVRAALDRFGEDRDLPRRCYSFDVVGDVRARAEWVPPDRTVDGSCRQARGRSGSRPGRHRFFAMPRDGAFAALAATIATAAATRRSRVSGFFAPSIASTCSR